MLITINTLGSGDTHIQHKLKHVHIDTHIQTVIHTQTRMHKHTQTNLKA